MGRVDHYFGLRSIHSDKCLSIDQPHLVHEIMQSVFGCNWRNQVAQKVDIVPMLPGTTHEEALAAAVKSYGFQYRT